MSLALTALSAAALVATAAPTAPVDAPSQHARTEDERNTIDVFRAVAPAVVNVAQRRVVRDFFFRPTQVQAGTGTGFTWDEKGHIVTNFHVVQDATAIQVTLRDGKDYPAKIVGVEPRKDIAVLRIKAPPGTLKPVRLPDAASPIEVGQKAIAIGNPFGLDHTLTTGVVSALGRQVDGVGGVTIRDMIQTDAAINPGNSGGPLLDSQGRLIGMNTQIYSRTGTSVGIGFAVPVTTIRRVVPQIIRTGRVEQVGMGIRILGDDIARRLNARGVVIADVQKRSPAAKAGLRGLRRGRFGVEVGDVIVAVAGARVEDYDDLYNALDRHTAGDTVKVTVLRNGRKLTVPVRLIVVNP